MVARCLKFIPISCMGPKHEPKDTYFIFSTNLYALEHVHVVQIWIMHINALKTQLMHKNVQTNPKNSHNTPVVLCWHEKTLESNKRQWIFFSQRWGVPYQNHHACCEKLWFVRSLYPNLHQMGQIFYQGMLMPLHDRMPSFMNFRRISDLLELQKQVRRRLPESHNAVVFEFHCHSLHGTSA